MAAFTLTGRIDYFIITPMLAIATALLTVVGQNWGHGNVTRTLNAYWAAVALAFYCAGVSRYAYCTGTLDVSLFTRVVAVVTMRYCKPVSWHWHYPLSLSAC